MCFYEDEFVSEEKCFFLSRRHSWGDSFKTRPLLPALMQCSSFSKSVYLLK